MAITNYRMVGSGSNSATPASLRHARRCLMLSRIQAEPSVSRAELTGGLGFFQMASLLALHTFCCSDRLDLEHLNKSMSSSDEGAAYA